MRIGIGLSQEPDPARAAALAVQEAKKAVPRPDLALVFASINYDQRKVHEALCREIDPAILMGGSCYAEITPAGVTKKSVAVLLLTLDGARVRFAGAELGDPRQTALALAGAIQGRGAEDGRLALGLLLSAVGTGDENVILEGLARGLGPVPFFGGLCCGDYDLGMTHPDVLTNYQYSGPTLTRRAARLALLDLPRADFELGFGFEHGWQPIGPVAELTRCKGEKVYEVGGVPVFDYYRQFLGREQSNDFFNTMVQRFSFSLLLDGAQGGSLLKIPVSCDFKEGCISFFPAEELQGRKVQMIQANRKGLIQGARRAALSSREALGGREAALVLIVSCCTRNAILNSRMDTEVDAIRGVFGPEVPVFGFYSGGELLPFLSRYEDVIDPGRACSGSHCHAGTIGVLAIATTQALQVGVPSRKSAGLQPEGPAEFARLKGLLAQSEEFLDVTESFFSNLSRKSYSDSEQLRRQNEIIHRYTPHDVWSEIGANVARGEYELSDSEFHGCFLFMDVKGFTSYSEQHSSKEVVAALNGIFDPATELIYACRGDVDKFIGDCIFAVFRKAEDAVEAGRGLLELVRRLREQGSPFDTRIGINMGRAVRANVGAKGRREYTYIGDAVNLAQRLESNCAPGKLLLSEDLFRQAGARFGSVERREIAVKGKERPVVAYECSI